MNSKGRAPIHRRREAGRGKLEACVGYDWLCGESCGTTKKGYPQERTTRTASARSTSPGSDVDDDYDDEVDGPTSHG